MGKKKRMIFGVISAESDNIEQRQILSGIIEQAQKFNIDTAVFSNIYNPNEPNAEVSCENMVYNLILSEETDALILIAESIVNDDLKQAIKDYLMKRRNVPVVIIGTYIPDFDLPGFRFINTSDENDIFDITNHLIEEHGFTDIDLLTGYEFLEASVLRVNGYRKSLEKHGVSYNREKVHFGDFWNTSGSTLAEKYINGELQMPQAVICTNDYMAYGMLDKFSEHGVRVPEDITVVGYEYIYQRIYHLPLLTTYQRSRRSLGIEAVKILYAKITENEDIVFNAPKGEIIAGDSCPCGKCNTYLSEEMADAREKKRFDHLNMYSQMEHRLTECSTIDDFIEVCGKFHFLVRDAHDIVLCLMENWYDPSVENKGDIMTCRSVVPWNADIPEMKCNKYQFSEIFSPQKSAAAYYFTPLFFSNRFFGYLVLRYSSPDAYDAVFRYWIKSVSNALELLRMKNDIKYLLQCQNLSRSRDSLTGMLNEYGFETEVKLALEKADAGERVIMIAVRTGLFSGGSGFDETSDKANTAIELSDAVKSLVNGEGEFCGRLNANTFAIACVGDYSEEYLGALSDKMTVLIANAALYKKKYGINSFVYASAEREVSVCDFYEMLEEINNSIEEQIDVITDKQLLPNYESYARLRRDMYATPQEIYTTQEVCDEFQLSYGYFRSVYREYFGISYHQDCIVSRISLAKYLLITTTLNLSSIAAECGYIDDKYFMHQFRSATGYTPNKYRVMHKNI